MRVVGAAVGGGVRCAGKGRLLASRDTRVMRPMNLVGFDVCFAGCV